MKDLEEEEEPSQLKETSDYQLSFEQTFNFDLIQRNFGSKVDTKQEADVFIKLSDLKPSYQVHLIESPNEDLKRAFDHIQEHKLVSLHVEQVRKKCSFLAISTSERAFVFNVNSLAKNKQFSGKISELFENPKISKISFHGKKVIEPLSRTMGSSLLNPVNFPNLKDNFATNVPDKINLSSMCFRLFGKRIDSMFSEWVSSSNFLGPDDLHYMAVCSLATLEIFKSFLRLKYLGQEESHI